jgi:hypothetical protein
MMLLLLAGCRASRSDRVPTAQLPNPAIYALSASDLPPVGESWQQSYNQTTEEQGYRWSYQAYQAYQPASLANQLDYAYAVNNDVYLYETDMSREDLPQPPTSLGAIQGVSWAPATQLHEVGDKSAVWKATVGDVFTPVWWLEFYKGHAYVRISLFGFPDQIAPALIYNLADTIAGRLPASTTELLADATHVVPTQPQLTANPVENLPSPSIEPSTPITNTIPVLSYRAPPGETGMVSFADETGSQLSDGVTDSDDILADLGTGTAYEWVGWTEQTEPVTLTFTLPASSQIAAVMIGISHREGLGIFVPSQVTINGQSFELAEDAVPNNQRGDLTFSGPFEGQQVTIVLNHRSRGWRYRLQCLRRRHCKSRYVV